VPKEQIPMKDLDAKEDLSYQKYPVKILETFERITWNKRMKMWTMFHQPDVGVLDPTRHPFFPTLS
jgi:hypothetical protein